MIDILASDSGSVTLLIQLGIFSLAEQWHTKIFSVMTSHLDSHTTTNVKLEMLSGVKTGNRIPHDENNVRGIAHARAYIKDDIFMSEQYKVVE